MNADRVIGGAAVVLMGGTAGVAGAQAGVVAALALGGAGVGLVAVVGAVALVAPRLVGAGGGSGPADYVPGEYADDLGDLGGVR